MVVRAAHRAARRAALRCAPELRAVRGERFEPGLPKTVTSARRCGRTHVFVSRRSSTQRSKGQPWASEWIGGEAWAAEVESTFDHDVELALHARLASEKTWPAFRVLLQGRQLPHAALAASAPENDTQGYRMIGRTVL
eukprot:scaffold24667_cov58-Phaeocystis_antarctica.AAC.6